MDVTTDCTPGTAAAVISPQEAAEVTDTLKALADPVRLTLFLTVHASVEEICVCDLPTSGLSQSTISHHLRKLRDADLVVGERRGTWVNYRCTPRGEAVGRVIARMPR